MRMIDKAVKTVSPRLEMLFMRLRSGTKGTEVMNESPSPNAIFSSHEMTMKEVSGKEIAVHQPHVAVNHVAGPVCVRLGVSLGKRIILETKFDDSIESGAIGKMFKCPS